MHTDATQGQVCRADAPPRKKIRSMWGCRRSPDVLARAGAMLREARESKRIPLRAVAARVGCSHVFIGEIERGASTLPVDMAEEICAMLDLDLAAVLCAFRLVPERAAEAFFDIERMRAALAAGGAS